MCIVIWLRILSRILLIAIVVPPLAPAWGVRAQDDSVLAHTINDEGGPVAITGQVYYTNPFFTTGVSAPMVILEDQAGFVDRNRGFILPPASQTLGQITSDFHKSPFTYSVALPIEPQGTLRDVDQNDTIDSGVMIFAVAYWTNKFGDPFLEERDLFGGGWSTAYASTRVSTDISNRNEIIGGKLLVFAPDDGQGFPSSSGPDRQLFSADDPIVRLPQGYTVVDLDSEPFLFDRARYPSIDLIEPAAASLADFSTLTYSAAFDAMLEKIRREYAFTDYKNINWDDLDNRFRSRFLEAEENRDRSAYLRALRELAYSIPDGHVKVPIPTREYEHATAGGWGMAIRKLDDGRILTTFILEAGPADLAGVQLGAEVVEINGQPAHEYIDAVVPWSGSFSTPHTRNLEQLRYALRAPVGTDMQITYKNPDDQKSRVAIIKSVDEQESFRISSLDAGITGFELPVEYWQLDSGLGYVRINSFFDNDLLTVQLWERLIQTLNDNQVHGLIIDLRQNSGGNGFLADQMAAYFFDEPLELGNSARYSRELDDFYLDPRTSERFYLPPENLRYRGQLAVLVGPNCRSACEFFANDLTLQERATIVGHYPTAGLGGSIDRFLMPEGQTVQFTVGRAVDMDGNIHIEGKGVVPSLRIPVTAATLLATHDPVLEAAVKHLENSASIPTFDEGELQLDTVITGTLSSGIRVRYRLRAEKGDLIDFHLEHAGGTLDTVLRVYGSDEVLLQRNDDDPKYQTTDSIIKALVVMETGQLIVEVAGYGDTKSGEYRLAAYRHREDPDAGSPASTDTMDSFEIAVVRSNGPRLQVYSAPSIDAPILGYVNSGAARAILETDEDMSWLRIAVPELPLSDSGWIEADSVEIVDR